MCVVAIGKESAVAQTGLKTIYNLLPSWNLSKRHISLFLNLTPCSSPEGHIEICHPRHIYLPKKLLTIQKIKSLCLYIWVFMWFEAEISRSGFLKVVTQHFQKC